MYFQEPAYYHPVYENIIYIRDISLKQRLKKPVKQTNHSIIVLRVGKHLNRSSGPTQGRTC